ncbi:transcriptional regulator VisR [Ciceribacter azotifigens]|uniref:transcriptional regulator VisR n=1 Tax=Ciceribacter azotifigens TaxID=2069303 RepID=UPI003A835B12
MKYPQGPLPAGKVQTGHARQINVRAEIFPKLVALQKSLGANGFAVLKIAGSGVPGKRKLVAQIDNWSTMIPAGLDVFLAHYGETLLSHLESSLLPLSWSAADESSFADTSDFSVFVEQLQPRVLSYSGIAFPVRLGASGNGYVLFAIAGGVDIAGERIIDVHSRTCKIMTDLLSLDERRTQPAETLSDREIACLQLAGDGRISEEIADALRLSVHTVNAYLGSATIKLDSVNRIQAIAKAIRLGYIT